MPSNGQKSVMYLLYEKICFSYEMSQRVEIVSNLQVKKGDLKVRHRRSQSSIFVRTFRSFTISLPQQVGNFCKMRIR